MKSIWKDKNFNILLYGGGISLIGSYIVQMSIIWEMLDHSDGASLIGSVMALSIIIPAILSSFMGTFVDRRNPKKLMIYLDSFQGILFVFLFFITNQWGLNLYINIFIIIIASFFNILYSLNITALYPKLFDKEGLQKTMSINMFLHSMTNIIGISLAGIMLLYMEVSYILLINGITFLLSAFFERFLEIKFEGKKVMNKEKSSFKEDFKIAFHEIKKIEILGYFIFAAMLNLSIVGLFYIGFVFVYKNVFLLTADKFSMANTVLPIGMMLASLLFTFAPKINNAYKFLKINVYLQGIVIISMGLILYYFNQSSGLIIFLACVFIFAFLNSVASVPARTVIMKKIPQDIIGKVFGVNHTIGASATALSNVLFGLMLDNMKAGMVFIAAGIFTIIINLFNKEKWYE